jgi:DNA-binding MarR family transcriptional regulator
MIGAGRDKMDETIGRLAAACRLLTRLQPGMTVGTALVFLVIARAEGIDEVTAAAKLGMEKSVLCRAVTRLRERQGVRFGVALGLVTFDPMPPDGRSKPMILTPRGKQLAAQLHTALTRGTTTPRRQIQPTLNPSNGVPREENL